MSENVLFDVPGPKGRRRARIINVISWVVILGVLVYVLIALQQKGQLTADKWSPMVSAPTWTAYLLPGLLSTVKAAGAAILCSIAFGLLFGVGRLSRFAPLRIASGIVVEFFRSVPVLILMIFFWYFLSFGKIVDAGSSPFFAVVVGLTLYNGSVIAEVVRASVENLPKGQREAGLAIGMTPRQTLRLIELPQALVVMMPALVAQLVVIMKDTALGYIVTYPELLRQARLVGTANGNLIPTLIVVAALFVVVNYSLGRLAEIIAKRLERRTAGSPEKVEAAAGQIV